MNIMKKGFTLAELSITIIVLGIVIYSTLAVFTGQADVDRVSNTRAKLEKIQDALRLYYLQNSLLPCPASGTASLSSENFGVSGAAGSVDKCDAAVGPTQGIYWVQSSRAMGVVPTRTLNLPDSYMFDGWGNRFNYVVTLVCTYGNWSSDCAGDINIKNNSVVDLATDAVYVVISAGKNGIGAWRRNGGSKRIARSDLTSLHERENSQVGTDGRFESVDEIYRDDFLNDGNIVDGGGVYLNYFDDLVKWKTKDQVDY